MFPYNLYPIWELTYQEENSVKMTKGDLNSRGVVFGVILLAVTLLSSMSQTADAVLVTKILDFDSAPTGTFTLLQEDGFDIT